MMRIWDALFAQRSQNWARRLLSNDPEANNDVELEKLFEMSSKVDSELSLDSPNLVSSEPLIPAVNYTYQEYRPLLLHLDLEDKTVTKQLHYETFARWDAMAGLMADLEKDGMIISKPWDMAEEMEVRSGDWDARVRQGWAIQLSCQYVYGSSQETDSDNGSDRDNGDYESVKVTYQTCKDANEEAEDWCLPRWRSRVERYGPIRGQTQEPSWRVLTLGCASMLFFVVTVIVYTA
ncbi:uncharacterized protein EKO05_0007536 [Ascochyta rabiei]|uniref:Uncharacterized protein n=1 Tax=Didymella rabiei TaxID=5454 RepID=A0A162YI89_DIDRA|nr:uncharacterized protein EKO05_0007536 [Ascochyta rabiei]KZM20059.1 hypothetical protein ST47_g8793 [Ascochyta rabiei]UPX17163.1 hypothetical protein EKO05_0007536 [Ascochyta rabiei]